MSQPSKAAYEYVAQHMNDVLKQYDKGEYQPRVYVSSHVDETDREKYFDDYSLFTNNALTDLVERPGIAQDLFYADNVYTFTQKDGTDYDMYIEPIKPRYFGLEKF